MIVSISAVILLIITLLKFLTKRFKCCKIVHVIGKIHCICGWLTVVLLVIHMIKGLLLFSSRPLYIYIIGLCALVVILLVVGSYYFRKSLGKKWILLHRFMACAAILLVVGHIGGYLYSVNNYQKSVNNITITSIDMEEIVDGVYEGECDVKYIYAKVKVEVKSGVITNIDIVEHRNEKGSAAESIINTIVKEQKIEVDAVSGATNSSKVIEKAVENALSE